MLSNIDSNKYLNIICTSRLYETPPAYVINQPSFLNCAVQIDTDMEPMELLSHIKNVEILSNREKTIRNGPRTLDIDILLYGDRKISYMEGDDINERIDGSLIIPHPLMHNRSFVLKPLSDLCPDVSHPVFGCSILQLLNRIKDIDVQDVLYLKNNRKIIWGDKTYIMGILNCTPDSFSDSGKYIQHDQAIKRVEEMISYGADIIDIGGQSSRPGSDKISSIEEKGSVAPHCSPSGD